MKGLPVEVFISFKGGSEISSPYFEMRIGEDQIPYMRHRGDFCRDINSKCSIDGLFSFHQKMVFPSHLVTGSYKMKIILYENAKPLNCRGFSIKIK